MSLLGGVQVWHVTIGWSTSLACYYGVEYKSCMSLWGGVQVMHVTWGGVQVMHVTIGWRQVMHVTIGWSTSLACHYRVEYKSGMSLLASCKFVAVAVAAAVAILKLYEWKILYAKGKVMGSRGDTEEEKMEGVVDWCKAWTRK
jgi:hypothetical protein